MTKNRIKPTQRNRERFICKSTKTNFASDGLPWDGERHSCQRIILRFIRVRFCQPTLAFPTTALYPKNSFIWIITKHQKKQLLSELLFWLNASKFQLVDQTKLAHSANSDVTRLPARTFLTTSPSLTVLVWRAGWKNFPPLVLQSEKALRIWKLLMHGINIYWIFVHCESKNSLWSAQKEKLQKGLKQFGTVSSDSFLLRFQGSAFAGLMRFVKQSLPP